MRVNSMWHDGRQIYESMKITSRLGSLVCPDPTPLNSLETSSILADGNPPRIFFSLVGGNTLVFSRVWMTSFHNSFRSLLRTVLSQYWAKSDNFPSSRSMRGAKMWSASAATSAWVLNWAWFAADPGPLIWAKSPLNSCTDFLIVPSRLSSAIMCDHFEEK